MRESRACASLIVPRAPSARCNGEAGRVQARFSARQRYACAQASLRPVDEAEFPAMGVHDRLRDRQPQADAAGLPAARLFEAVEGLEDAGELRLGDPGAMVVDRDL